MVLQQVFGLAAKPKDAADTSVLKAPLGASPVATPASWGGHRWLWVALRTLKERQCRSEPKG